VLITFFLRPAGFNPAGRCLASHSSVLASRSDSGSIWLAVCYKAGCDSAQLRVPLGFLFGGRKMEDLVHTTRMAISEREYEILVFLRSDGRFLAKTYFSPVDVIINDGPSVAEVLARHEQVLPLAVNSRDLLGPARLSS
jgi:hypothetical protein